MESKKKLFWLATGDAFGGVHMYEEAWDHPEPNTYFTIAEAMAAAGVPFDGWLKIPSVERPAMWVTRLPGGGAANIGVIGAGSGV